MKKLAELLQQRAAALAAWKALVDKATVETRDLNADEEKREGELKAEVADLDKKIERARALQEAERSAPAVIDHRNLGDGQWEDRARQFSITNSMRAAMGEAVDVGREKELTAELTRRTGRKFSGIGVPDEAFAPLQKRTVTTTDGGGSLVPQVHRPDLFIDRLRPSLILPALGATVLDGLVGNIDIPKQLGSSVAQWIAEEESLTETDADFDDLELSPHTVGAMTSFSRRMLINAVPSVEDLIRRDLSAVIANAVDLAALFGDGTGNTPMGISATPGVHQVSMAGGATWAKVLELVAAVEGANALGGSLGWAISAWGKQVLRSTHKTTGQPDGFIMEAPDQLAGYRAATSSVLGGDPANSPTEPAGIIFGDWQQLILAAWSGVDILVNPYAETAYAKGRVMVRAMRDVDVGVRQAAAFAVTSDLPTS